MPRTKVSRNTKRNRESVNREQMAVQLRDFDVAVDQLFRDFEFKRQQVTKALAADISMLKKQLPEKLLQMKLKDLFKINTKVDKVPSDTELNKGNRSNDVQKFGRERSRDDEGYLTEDSAGVLNATQGKISQKPRLPGPLSSAKAKSRRRSRSACGYFSAVTQKSGSIVEHSSRSRLRTPLMSRSKAQSADRVDPVTPKVPLNAAISLLRYPKAGETVISLSGSPVVAQSIQDKTANVNIPVRNGVLSLRPAKMQDVDPDVIKGIDAETLDQIKQLQSNLNMIMSIADNVY